MIQVGPYKRAKHPLAGKKVTIKDGAFKGCIYWVEDWQVNVYNGQSWREAIGNAAALEYALRLGMEMAQEKYKGDVKLSSCDDVLYGKIDGLGKMIHISQIGEVIGG